MSPVMCHLSPVTCHLLIMPTATASDLPPARFPIMHSKAVSKDPKTHFFKHKKIMQRYSKSRIRETESLDRCGS